MLKMLSKSFERMHTYYGKKTDRGRQSASVTDLPSSAANGGEKSSEAEIWINFYDKTKIVKPGNDNCMYEAIRLSNEMKVLLISDPTVNKCAAALAVQAGKAVHLKSTSAVSSLESVPLRTFRSYLL